MPSTSLSFAQLQTKLKVASRNLDNSTLDSLNRAGLAAKEYGLDILQRRTLSTQAGSSRYAVAGFSRHRRRTGRQFYIRYTVNGFRNYVAVWAVPPGPYMLNTGAQAHVTGRQRRHPGFRGRRWKSEWEFKSYPQMARIIEGKAIDAFFKPFVGGVR